MNTEWAFGFCVTGFLFLAGWTLSLSLKFGTVLETAKKVSEIHLALLGDMANEGLISRARRLEDNCRLHVVISVFDRWRSSSRSDRNAQ